MRATIAAMFLVLAACASKPDRRGATVGALPPEPPQPPPLVVDPPPPPAWLDHTEIPSNAKRYVIHVEPAPATLPDNEPFALEVWIADAREPAELCPGVALAVDAAMPEHGHGMNRAPKITELEPGHFRVEGLLFHMTGHWELYFDVTRDALTERAQTDVLLE